MTSSDDNGHNNNDSSDTKIILLEELKKLVDKYGVSAVRESFKLVEPDFSGRDDSSQAAQEAQMNQSIFDSSFDAIVVSDEEGYIVKVNPSMLQIFRFQSAEQLIGKNIQILVGEHGAMDRTNIGTTRQLVARRSDGSEFPCKIGIRRVEGTGFIVAFIQEITTASAMEEAGVGSVVTDLSKTSASSTSTMPVVPGKQLDEDEEGLMYQTILEVSFDAIIVTNDDGIISLVNPSVMRVFGFEKKEDVVGRNIEILLGKDVESYVKSTMTGDKAFVDKRVLAYRQSGFSFPCQIGIRKVRDTEFTIFYVHDLERETRAMEQALMFFSR